MMSNSPSNPIIYKLLKQTILRDISTVEQCYDYDNFKYKIMNTEKG